MHTFKASPIGARLAADHHMANGGTNVLSCWMADTVLNCYDITPDDQELLTHYLMHADIQQLAFLVREGNDVRQLYVVASQLKRWLSGLAALDVPQVYQYPGSISEDAHDMVKLCETVSNTTVWRLIEPDGTTAVCLNLSGVAEAVRDAIGRDVDFKQVECRVSEVYQGLRILRFPSITAQNVTGHTANFPLSGFDATEHEHVVHAVGNHRVVTLSLTHLTPAMLHHPDTTDPKGD